VPDVYQGTEFWDLSLVDPDNRRPVDYHARRVALAELPATLASGFGDAATARTLLERWLDGHLKLYVLRLALKLRDAYPALFAAGTYDALPVRGARSQHVVAFARRHEAAAAVVAVGRLFVALDDGKGDPGQWAWNDTTLHLNGLGNRAFVDIFTGRRFAAESPADSPHIPISRLFSTLPVAALIAAP
jgi:(1->4)-alpha-D-glucan 1-alpha-D-glucosylmutase